jgi:CRP-like cAMP-binding protein
LPDVKRAIAEADEKIAHPPPRPFPWAWAALGVTLVSFAAFGALWGRRWWKGRYRIAPAQVIELIGAGQTPVMVDARRPQDFDTSPLELLRAVRLSPQDAEAGRIALEVEPGQIVVVYCASPDEATSARVAALLRKRGLGPVRILKGGIGSWTNAGLPVATKSSMPSLGVELYRNLAAREASRRRLRAGDVILTQGDPDNDEAYLVHTGRVEIRQMVNGTPRVLTTLGEGELFGEMALFRSAARSVTAVATTDVELLVIRQERLEWLIRNRPQVTLEILKRLSDLLAKAERADGPPGK